MPILSTESPAMAYAFRCAGRTRAGYRLGLLGAVVSALVLLLLRRTLPGSWYAGAAAAGALVAYAGGCWLRLVRARDVYVVFDEGVVRRTPGGGERSARWAEVAAVRERPVLRRLELLDACGERLLALDYGVEGFARLRCLVMERTARPRAPEAGVPEGIAATGAEP